MRHALALVVVLAGSSAATAQLDIRMDIGNSVSTTPGNWNNIGSLTGLTPNLIDFSSGLGTGVSIDGTGSAWRPFFGDDAGAFPNQDWLIQPATRARLVQGGHATAARYDWPLVAARIEEFYLQTLDQVAATKRQTFSGQLSSAMQKLVSDITDYGARIADR